MNEEKIENMIKTLESALKTFCGENVETSRDKNGLNVICKGDHLEVFNVLVEKYTDWHLTTITCVDDLENKKFDLIYHLLLEYILPVNVVIYVDREKAELDSVTKILPAANIYEREIFDLFGIKFKGHPFLKRLLLHDNWPDGQYPLRKDFEIVPTKGVRKIE